MPRPAPTRRSLSSRRAPARVPSSRLGRLVPCLLLLTACGPGGEPIIEAPVYTVAISGPTTVEEGSTIQLAAAVASTGESASQSVTWSSDNTDVAQVDGSGVVTGVSVGSASITATSTEDASATATQSVTVTAAASISGIVFNDRDADGRVDPDEALSGVTLALNGPVSRTTTTDASGAYTFAKLPAGTYSVAGDSEVGNSNIVLLRSLFSGDISVTVAAGQKVGSTNPTALPRWNYNTSSAVNLGATNFTFLFRNNVVLGTVTDGWGSRVAGITVSLRMCQTSSGASAPPIGGRGCSSYRGTTINTVTDNSGQFFFAGMTEGVYEITPYPATIGYTRSSPSRALYLLVGNGDIEDMTFIVS